jgi:hypothetical protein
MNRPAVNFSKVQNPFLCSGLRSSVQCVKIDAGMIMTSFFSLIYNCRSPDYHFVCKMHHNRTRSYRVLIFSRRLRF